MYRSMVAQIKHTRQSPINIQSNDVTVDEKKCQVRDLKFVTKPGDCDLLEIGDTSLKINAINNNILTGSHLTAKYQLLQFHFHWGEDSSVGSEHLIDGRAYSGEVHFVFWNTSYGNPDKAVNHSDGLTVLGVLIKEGEYNDAYSNITSLIRRALEGNKTSKVTPNLDLNLLLPRDRNYFTYDGSLTTPPFSENVIWTLLMDTVQMSAKQLACFRLICPANYRECQFLAGRKICCSTNHKKY